MAPLRVLIVDDSLTIRALVETIVAADRNCRVVGVAPDVATARALIDVELPNVITLDLAMPGVDGLCFLDELATHAHAPVLVLSSSTTPGSDAAREAMAHGADGCFDKGRVLTDSKGFLRALKGAAKRGWHGHTSH